MSATSTTPTTTAGFDSTAVYEPTVGLGTVLITGSATNATNIANIEVSDGGTTLGGTGGFQSSNPGWGFVATLAPGKHILSATVTELSGATYSITSPYELVTGIQNQPYVYQEVDHTASGGVAATTSYAADGTVVSRSNDGGPTVNGGSSTAEVIRSAYDDVMTGDGSGSTTFQFRRGFGQDEITNFQYLSAAQSPTGIEHDVISLPHAVFTKMAQVMRHTTSALDGSAVIHLSPTDSIKLDGVTKADLITHPNVFRFHS